MFSAILSSGPLWAEILVSSIGDIIVPLTSKAVINAIKDGIK